MFGPNPAFRLLFLCLVCIGIGQSMLFAILPPAAREIGITPFQVSTVFASSATLWVFVSPWWGRRSDVWGRRPVILLGLLGYALSMALMATTIVGGVRGVLAAAATYPLLVASRLVFALLGSGTGPAAQAYIADRTTYEERTAGMAIVNAAMGLGQTIGPAVGAALAVVGLVAPLYFSAVLAVASAAVIARFLPEPELPAAPEVERGRGLGFRDERIRAYLLIRVALQATSATTMITLALYMQDMLALTPTQAVQYAGAGFVVLAVAGLVTQLVVVQRMRPSARFMMQLGMPLQLASFCLLVVGSSFVLQLVALALLGAGTGLVRPGSAAGASLAVEPHEQGAVAGILGGLSVVGNIFGPMLGTGLYGLSPRAPYLINAAMMAVGTVFVLRSRDVRALRA
jgi:MFS family permease